MLARHIQSDERNEEKWQRQELLELYSQHRDSQGGKEKLFTEFSGIRVTKEEIITDNIADF